MMKMEVIENKEGLSPAMLGSCNDHTRQLHASLSVCEYFEWAQFEHSIKVYQRECNLQNDSWKSELRDYELNRNGNNGPRLLDVLEGFLKFEIETMGGNSRRESETETSSRLESRKNLLKDHMLLLITYEGTHVFQNHRRGGSGGYRKDKLRNVNKDSHGEVMRASSALENHQLDRKTKNLTFLLCL
ncbi:unnamed protein product [Eruca vesicaria subsp. sativa]|uniref:Uncharacterized protein n=1 Tax=Eruca vesicaria subsp. sativa TaxID=29727 RepID=A0ABC8KMQ5_ERUVS|nr:unnamed protein product [Eruca vesicaria subsp. sativa]